MVKLVLRLSGRAKLGLVLVVVGVAFGLYGRLAGEVWALRASIPPVVVGAVLYYSERYKDFKRRRKP